MIGRGELIRREFLKVGGAGLDGVALMGDRGCGVGSGAMSDSTVFVSWGGSDQEEQEKAWIRPFSEMVDFEVNTDSLTDYAKLQSMVESRQAGWDAEDVGSDFMIGGTTNLLEPLDYSVSDREPISWRDVQKSRGSPMARKVSLTRQNWGKERNGKGE